MIAKFAADAVVLIHFLFILFVVLGGLLVLKWHRLALIHIPCVVWGILVEFFGWICPLTPMENALRQAAGGVGYSGGFIGYYLMPLIYPEGLTRDTQVWLGLFVLTINLFAYGLILFYRNKRVK
jgi:drug/metabolite transporter superfamily protein YnfA